LLRSASNWGCPRPPSIGTPPPGQRSHRQHKRILGHCA
jgi:hypothetical protein